MCPHGLWCSLLVSVLCPKLCCPTTLPPRRARGPTALWTWQITSPGVLQALNHGVGLNRAAAACFGGQELQ